MTDERKARENILIAAREYVSLGLPIIPLCSHNHVGYSEKHVGSCQQAGKVPVLKGWREQTETTYEQLTSWIREFRNFNIGLPLGNVSGYVGIDVDGEFGEDMLYEMSHGDLPETWQYTTGAGRRLLYAIPIGLQTKKYVNPHEDGDHNECSIICDGQQTVLPPSVHHTGRVYEWLEDHSPMEMDCAMAPEWLLDLVRVDESRRGPSAPDLTRPNNAKPVDGNTLEVKPLLVTSELIPIEFTISDVDAEMDLTAPDPDYMGKSAKGQKEEDAEDRVDSEELLQVISSGNRDNQMTRIIGSFCAQFRNLGKDYIMVMSKNHNRQFCAPPLDDAAIEAKVNHFWHVEEMKTSQYKSLSDDDTKVKKFAPNRVAQVAINLLEEQGFCLKADAESTVVWMTKKSEGPWYPADSKSNAFYTYIRDAVGDPEKGGDPTWTTIRHFKDVANALVVELRAAGRLWEVNTKNTDTQTITSYPYIPLAGGKLLNWRTGELLAWDPETNLTYVLPVEYDPNAKAPNWDARLKEWLPDAGSRAILQEFVGYSLIPYMGFEKALSIQGEGANGKSLFLETIQGLLGYKVVDSINMRNLFSRFGQADLVGKILNIVNEAGSDYLRGSHADDFKNLVSGGRIKADVKNLAPLTFNNTAKFIFASNHDIKTGDKSEGWLRRMLIVPFEQDFRNSQTPKFEIMEQLRQEYSGIFNWALEGLRRLVEQQQFSESESANRKKQAYIRENDIAADFFMNCLERFDLETAGEDGKAARSGTPTALINQLFGHWIEYRESSVQKRTEHITKHLERKHGFVKARTKHCLMVKKVMTECWIGLRIHIRDTGFLEALINEPIVKYHELKDYAIRRLEEIDASNGWTGSSTAAQTPASATVTNFPDSQVN